MANVYVRSGAGGAATGADWANAYLTLEAALAGSPAAGNDFWVSEDHVESKAGAINLTNPGTYGTPCRVICVNHAGTVPPVAADITTGATITSSGSNAITLGGSFYCSGIAFSSGTTGSTSGFAFGVSTGGSDMQFKNCSFYAASTTATPTTLGITTASAPTRILWDNCTWKVAAAGSVLSLLGDFTWINTASAIQGATLPTNLFGAATSGNGTVFCNGVDFSALSSKTLVIAALTKGGRFFFHDCAFPASITINGAPTSPMIEVYVTRSASGATAYTIEKHDLRGNQTTDITTVRTGGKSINSTPVAMKIIGTANALQLNPFRSTPMVINNGTIGSSRTLTVYGYWSGASVPNNDEVWLEIGYLASGSAPIATITSTFKATPLTAGAAGDNSADTSTWGAGGTTKFKITKAFTPNLAGEIYVTVCTASTNTIFIDPLPVLS